MCCPALTLFGAPGQPEQRWAQREAGRRQAAHDPNPARLGWDWPLGMRRAPVEDLQGTGAERAAGAAVAGAGVQLQVQVKMRVHYERRPAAQRCACEGGGVGAAACGGAWQGWWGAGGGAWYADPVRPVCEHVAQVDARAGMPRSSVPPWRSWLLSYASFARAHSLTLLWTAASSFCLLSSMRFIAVSACQGGVVRAL